MNVSEKNEQNIHIDLLFFMKRDFVSYFIAKSHTFLH